MKRMFCLLLTLCLVGYSMAGAEDQPSRGETLCESEPV